MPCPSPILSDTFFYTFFFFGHQQNRTKSDEIDLMVGKHHASILRHQVSGSRHQASLEVSCIYYALSEGINTEENKLKIQMKIAVKPYE